MDEAEMDLRGPELVRPQRPWALIVAALLLVVLVAVLWAKWSESRGEVERLRAELKAVYSEAEALRTLAAQAQQRVTILEKQVQGIRTERDEANSRATERLRAEDAREAHPQERQVDHPIAAPRGTPAGPRARGDGERRAWPVARGAAGPASSWARSPPSTASTTSIAMSPPPR